MSSPTASFLGDEAEWSAVQIKLFDVHGLWGGRAITVEGTGEAIVQVVPAARWERRYHLALTSDEVRNLLTLFVENDFLTVAFPQRASFFPDETQATITLINPIGEAHTVTRWAADPTNERFDTLCALLLELEHRTVGMNPDYEGKPDWP